jgi:hypothetical protein
MHPENFYLDSKGFIVNIQEGVRLQQGLHDKLG